MNIKLLFATFFIATCALSTSVKAQKVYRCGSNYSQTPCPDAVAIEVEDTRTKTQKSESDARVLHETAAADAMEKKRLQDEALSLADANAKTTVHAKKNIKKSSGKKKGPEFFTARVTPEKSKPKTALSGTR